jgi:two-component system sensor histidine kinase PilS (NtrC family)
MSSRPVASDDERTLGKLIVRESDRLARLLSEFLDFARVRVTRREPVDVGSVVRGAARLALAHPGRAEGARLEVAVRDEPLVVLGDEDLLHRAVFNLVLNAVQATEPGTEVRLSASLATGEELPPGVPFGDQAVALQVTDRGPGIAADVQERLFEPFTTTKRGGSGLGLAIAHRAIEAHRGVVLVDTDANGTRFTVLLPRALPAREAAL